MPTLWFDKLRGVVARQNGVQVPDSGRVSELNFLDSELSYDAETGVLTVGFGTRLALTAQTASIGTTALVTAPAPGLFQVDVYLSTTTAGSAGTVLATVGYTDRAGATTQATTTLALNALGRLPQRMLVYAASGNITYATTVASSAGSPQYALDLAVRRLTLT